MLLTALEIIALMVAATVIGALCICWISGIIQAADGSGGLSLISANWGLPQAVIGLAMASVPAVVLGILVSATGNPLSGVFVVAASLCALAAITGPVDGWIYRLDLPTKDYGLLILEMLLWHQKYFYCISNNYPDYQKKYSHIWDSASVNSSFISKSKSMFITKNMLPPRYLPSIAHFFEKNQG